MEGEYGDEGDEEEEEKLISARGMRHFTPEEEKEILENLLAQGSNNREFG